jgi:hypothetical protein
VTDIYIPSPKVATKILRTLTSRHELPGPVERS